MSKHCQRQHARIGVADTEVIEPAVDVEAQFVDDVLHPVSPVAAGDFSHPLLEACVGFGRPHHASACPDLGQSSG